MADDPPQAAPMPAVVPLRRRRCPICGAPPVERFRPFCSARCRQVDLGRWLDGRYAVPGAPLSGSGPGEGPGDSDDQG